MDRMAPSGIRKVNEKALEMERAGKTVIHFEIGRPDFDTPDYIKKAAIESIQAGNVFYTSNFGTMTAVLIGCSLTFEARLLEAGIRMAHYDHNKRVPMYDTNIACEPYGHFKGNYVVSMRPIPEKLVDLAVQITEPMEYAHGGPVHIGDPAAIGIRDLLHPDYGDPPVVAKGDVPVFWACGVTAQSVAMEIVFRKNTDRDYQIYSFGVKQDYQNFVDYECPARLTRAQEEEMTKTARRVYEALGCQDFARVDFRLSDDNRLYFIEINPLPGLAPGYSDYPMETFTDCKKLQISYNSCTEVAK